MLDLKRLFRPAGLQAGRQRFLPRRSSDIHFPIECWDGAMKMKMKMK